MLKKIISLFVILATLATLGLTAQASIATSGTYMLEDFTAPEGSVEWKPEGWSIGGGTTDIQAIGHITEEGYVEILQNGAGGSVQARKNLDKSLPSEFTVMFDINFRPTIGKTVYVSCALGGYQVGTNAYGHIGYVDETGTNKTHFISAPEFDVWYSYIIQVKDGFGTYYRKKRDEAEFQRVAENMRFGKSTEKEHFRVYAYDANNRDGGAWIDNVKIFAGTYITDQSVTINEEKTQIKGIMEVSSAEVGVNETKTIIPVMAAYDKKGKILDMEMLSESPLIYNENTFEITMDINEEFYENLKGGRVTLFLLTPVAGFRPQSSVYTLYIQ